MTEGRSCADVSRGLDEPLHGTASRVRNWLLVEQPGPWGSDAVAESTLDGGVAARLKSETGRHRIRLLLIKRPRTERATTGLRVFAAHTGLDHQWIQECHVEDASELLQLDFAGLREGQVPALGRAWARPLYLVCTNGAHDPCCERYGCPVARGLAGDRDEETWECSHVGGDRFAANLVCLPHGLYFGRVTPDDAREIAALYEHGLIHLDHYRGRSCYEPVVQAADILTRVAQRLPGIDDLTPESRRDHEGGESTVTFRDRAGDRHEIRIAVRRAGPRRVTCHASHPGAPREYRVVSRPA